MQQSGFSDLQLLQQQLMFKQMQDLHRQQQFQQHNHLNQFSPVHKQANYSQLSPLVDGMPQVDASQGYLSWMRRSSSPVPERTSNRIAFSKGFNPQEYDDSLYGTPVANARANMSQQSTVHVMHHDSVNLFPKTRDQTHNSVMPFSDLHNPFLKHQYNFAQDQILIPQEGLTSNQGFQGKSMLGTGLVGLDGGLASGDVPMGNTEEMTTSPKVLKDRQGVSWSEVRSEVQPKATQPSKGLVPLDPLEEKILFDMEDNNFSDICSGGFGNTFDNLDLSSAVPAIQRGSWSALMQSAVAEASSSDTGIQEEWSGLSFQNTEPSTENNQTSNLIDSDKNETVWMNNSLPSSLSLDPLTKKNNFSNFPNFQQLGNQLSDQQNEGIYQDGIISQSVQVSPKVTGQWVDRTPHQKPSMEGNQQGSHVHSNALGVGNNILEQLSGTVNNVKSHSIIFSSRQNDSHESKLADVSNPFQMASSVDISRRAHWNNASETLRNAGMSSQLNVINFSPGSSLRENIYHMQDMVNASLVSQSAEAPDADNMHTPLNLATSFVSARDNSMVPASSYNVWSDLQTQKHPSEHELFEDRLHSSPSTNVSGNRIMPKVLPSEATDNLEIDLSKKVLKTESVPAFEQVAASLEHNSRFKVSEQNGMNSTKSRLGSFASGDTNLLSLMLEARKNSSNQSGITGTGQCHQIQFNNSNHTGLATIIGQRHFQTQFNSSDVVSDLNERGLIIPHTTPTWNRQLETVYESRTTPGFHLPSLESTQHADKRPNDVAILVESKQINSSYPVPSIVMNQKFIMRPKKRKLMQMAWHNEVTQGFDNCQSISMEDQEWAHASNRLLEKIDDKRVQLVPQSKRRLVFTTKLIQQLINPAPAFSLLADACLVYDTVSYFVARATLGDTCSLICSERRALTPSSDEINIISKKHKTSRTFSVVEGFIAKAEKMGKDLQKSEKEASFTDIRLEIQDLERFAVINRFAKFHSRAQAETSGNPLSTATPKPIPQRYVTAVTLPRNLPDGTPCISL